MRALRWLQCGFLMLGFLLVGSWARAYGEAARYQAVHSRAIDAAIRGEEPDTSLRFGSFVGEPAAGPSEQADARARVLGRLEIPRLRIAAVVAEGTDPATLDRAVGHIPATALPGESGNCALAGHRDSYLRGLGGVRPNDVILIVTPERIHVYRVQWSAVVEPQRVDVLDATLAPALTLVTCYPFAFVGPAPQRFIVRALRVDEPAARL